MHLNFSNNAEFFGKEFQIFDINGRVVIQDNLSDFDNPIDVSILNKGLYFIKIDEVLQKFIKQ